MDGADEGDLAGGVDVARQVSRLRRIEGQVRGLQQMVGTGRPRPDVTVQIDAVIGALRRVRSDLARAHLKDTVRAVLTEDRPADERRRMADELGAVLSRLV